MSVGEYGGNAKEPDAVAKLRSIVGSRNLEKFLMVGIDSVRKLADYTPADLISLKVLDEYDEAARVIRMAREAVGETLLLDYKRRVEIRSLPRLTTGIKAVDELLGGGLEPGKIYGIAGEFGAGKSRFCHQLCVTVQLPPIEGKAVYLDSENVFMDDLIRGIASKMGIDPDRAVESVLVVDSSDYFNMEEFLRREWPSFIEEGYKLLVIDTLIGPFRQQFPGREHLAERQQRLNRVIGWVLKHVRRRHLYCVITDQVQAEPTYGGSLKITGGHVLAHGMTYWYWIQSAGSNVRRIMAYDVINKAYGESALFKITDDVLTDV